MSFDDMFSIKGKTALVTGGSKGIGEMIASGFVARGAKVYIVARNAEICAATASRISEEDGGEGADEGEEGGAGDAEDGEADAEGDG